MKFFSERTCIFYVSFDLCVVSVWGVLVSWRLLHPIRRTFLCRLTRVISPLFGSKSWFYFSFWGFLLRGFCSFPVSECGFSGLVAVLFFNFPLILCNFFAFWVFMAAGVCMWVLSFGCTWVLYVFFSIRFFGGAICSLGFAACGFIV